MSADHAQYAVAESRETPPRGARGAEPVDEAAAIVLTGALMLAVAEVSPGKDQAAARVLADRVLAVIGRIDIRSRG